LPGLATSLGIALGGIARAGDDIAATPADTCPLCAEILPVPVVRLEPALLDSLARADALFNQARLAQIDSLLQAGDFGAPDRDEARRAAHLLARVSTANSYRYLARFAADTEHVWEASESTLVEVASRYSDVSLVCIARLERLRMGLGHACLHYALDEDGEGETVLGGKRMRWDIRDEKLGGERRRVLRLDLPSGSSDMVEVMLGAHYSFAFEQRRNDGPPGPYEWFVVKDIRGGWLRKWGTHQPTAFMFWSSPLRRSQPELPDAPLVGVRIYVPHLKLKLPFILPDINFDDLREIDLPQPILEMAYLRDGRHPSWLEIDAWLGFKGWKGNGAVPQHVRRAFPDD
jgi:hypothetical protein